MAQNIHYCSKMEERSLVRKYWTKARPKPSWANSKLSISMSDVKVLFGSPTPFSFVDCNTLFFFSLELIPLPVSHFLHWLSHCSGIYNILGALSLQFQTMALLSLHAEKPLPYTWTQKLSSVAEGDSITSFFHP